MANIERERLLIEKNERVKELIKSRDLQYQHSQTRLLEEKRESIKLVKKQTSQFRIKINKLPPKIPKQVNWIKKNSDISSDDFQGRAEGVIERRATLKNLEEFESYSPSSFQPRFLKKVTKERPKSMRDRFILNDMKGLPLSIDSFIQVAGNLKQDLDNGVVNPKIGI